MATWAAQARPDLVEGALDDLGPLMRRRFAARDSSAVTIAGLAEMDERIAALSAAVSACGVSAQTLRQGLDSGDPEVALAIIAVAPALEIPGPWWQEALALVPTAWWPVVIDHARRGRSPALEAACAGALASLPTTIPFRWLLECLQVVCGRSSARGGAPLPPCLKSGLGDPLPTVRALTWEVLWRRGDTVDASVALRGIQDPEAEVRRACVESLVWMLHPNFAQQANNGIIRRTPVDHEIILQWARLAAVEAVPPLVRLALKPGQETLCVPLLLTIALPQVAPALITVMDSKDVPLAVAAGRAFRQITGLQVDSAQRVTLPPTPGQPTEEVDQELLVTGWLPDRERAQGLWTELSSTLDPRRRLSAGRMVNEGTTISDPTVSTAAWRSAAMRAVYLHGERRPTELARI